MVSELMQKLEKRYTGNIYRWFPNVKDELMILNQLAVEGEVKQSDLIEKFGIGLGGKRGSDNLRAAKIAMNRVLGLTVTAVGHGDHRVYTLSDHNQKRTVVAFMKRIETQNKVTAIKCMIGVCLVLE